MKNKKEKYDGWVMYQPEMDYIDVQSFQQRRSTCIEEFENHTGWNWRQAKRRGWRCVKVRLVVI